MNDDPIVDEVRQVRDEYSKKFEYDLDSICRDLQKKQERPGKQIVSFPPKRPRVTTIKK